MMFSDLYPTSLTQQKNSCTPVKLLFSIWNVFFADLECVKSENFSSVGIQRLLCNAVLVLGVPN